MQKRHWPKVVNFWKLVNHRFSSKVWKLRGRLEVCVNSLKTLSNSCLPGLEVLSVNSRRSMSQELREQPERAVQESTILRGQPEDLVNLWKSQNPQIVDFAKIAENPKLTKVQTFVTFLSTGFRTKIDRFWTSFGTVLGPKTCQILLTFVQRKELKHPELATRYDETTEKTW